MSYFCYQDILTNTVSGVFEDLKFKISEGSDQNWSCPDFALLAVSANTVQYMPSEKKIVFGLKVPSIDGLGLISW
jgi:hypothetical protein